ncbi:ribonuclease H1 domain-containing protein [Bacillus fungorum]|uniref:ribonuclease H1 domain-containing protein n=1 Tax=Bacillus fungorum TaxID=2039284 RepID=UPI003F57FB9B
MGKYYAVKKGRKKGVFTTWNECKMQVDGYPNAQYKSFSSYEEAYAFANGDSKINTNTIDSTLKSYEIQAYIDGSFDNVKKYYSYAGIIFYNNEKIDFAFADNDSSIIEQRNVAGEVKAAMYVMNFALKKKVKSIEIFYDYAGIENWATKAWKAKNDFTKQYVEFIEKIEPELKVKFSKVKAHSGIKYNEEVDQLAKSALKNIKDDSAKIVPENAKPNYTDTIGELKSSKRGLNLGFVIDGIAYSENYIYEQFKCKWKANKRKINEIIEIKSAFDTNTSKFIFCILNASGNWETFELHKGEV